MKGTIGWIVAGIALVGLVVWRFSARSAEEGKLKQQQGQRRGGGATVEVAPVVLDSITETLDSVGSAETPYKVLISPKLSGRIEYLVSREGDPVKPGEVLVRIDDSEVTGQVLQYQAAVAEARSRYAQALLNQTPTVVGVSTQIAQQQAAVNSAQADYDQVQRNYESQVAASNSEVTDHEGKVAAAESQVNNANAQVDLQKANLASAQAKYDRTKALKEKGYVSDQALEDARNSLDVQKQSLKVAIGQFDAAKSALKSANALLNASRQQAAIVGRKGKADIAASKAKLEQARASLDLAIANKAITPAYKQNLAALQADIDAAKAQLAQAKTRRSDTELKSPIEGTVTARKADVGTLATPGQPILEVQFLDWLYVTASFPIENGANVREGLSANITFDALAGRSFTGSITNVNFAADPQTRQFQIRIRLDNKDHMIRPGMFGHVSLITGKSAKGPVVPREALKIGSDGKTATVTVVDSESVAHIRDVKIGVQDAARAQVISGVEVGDRVVVLTYAPIQDGKKVTVGGWESGKSGGSSSARKDGATSPPKGAGG